MFYHLYNLKEEELPSEEEWEVRMEQLEITSWQPTVQEVGQQPSKQEMGGLQSTSTEEENSQSSKEEL